MIAKNINMKNFICLFILVIVPILGFVQTDKKIDSLEFQKKVIELEIKKFNDSIKSIDLKIAQLKTKKFLDKIKDSSLTVMVRKGGKLRKNGNVYSDPIKIFKEKKEVIILDYKNGYFEVCQDSICGYINEVWITHNSSTSEFIKSKETEKKLKNGSKKGSAYSETTKSNNSSYKRTNRKSYRTYYRGPRGGCYYINSKGNKTYVSRSYCN